jgi:hypothetical protein
MSHVLTKKPELCIVCKQSIPQKTVAWINDFGWSSHADCAEFFTGFHPEERVQVAEVRYRLTRKEWRKSFAVVIADGQFREVVKEASARVALMKDEGFDLKPVRDAVTAENRLLAVYAGTDGLGQCLHVFWVSGEASLPLEIYMDQYRPALPAELIPGAHVLLRSVGETERWVTVSEVGNGIVMLHTEGEAKPRPYRNYECYVQRLFWEKALTAEQWAWVQSVTKRKRLRKAKR